MGDICHRDVNDMPRVKRVGHIIFSLNKFDVKSFKEAMRRGVI